MKKIYKIYIAAAATAVVVAATIVLLLIFAPFQEGSPPPPPQSTDSIDLPPARTIVGDSNLGLSINLVGRTELSGDDGQKK